MFADSVLSLWLSSDAIIIEVNTVATLHYNHIGVLNIQVATVFDRGVFSSVNSKY